MNLIWRLAYIVAKPFLMIVINKSRRTRVLVYADGKLLVIKNRLGDGTWVLPGGGLHKHEPANQGAVRELAEETGLTVPPSSIEFLVSEPVKFGWGHYKCHYFVTHLDKPQKTQRQWYEVSEIAWLDPGMLTPENSGLEVVRGLALSGHQPANLVQ